MPYASSQLHFDGLKSAQTAIERLRNYRLRLDTERFADGASEKMAERTSSALVRFEQSLDDDLNTAEALGAIFEFIRDTNTAMDLGEFRQGNVAAAQDLLRGLTACSTCCAQTRGRGVSPTPMWTPGSPTQRARKSATSQGRPDPHGPAGKGQAY